MNLTNFQKKLIWGVGVLSIICLWIAFPLIFKVLIESYKLPEDFNSLGPFGDIYGSLNTLISSIALCAVAYSAWLQVTSLKESRLVNDVQIRESRNAIFANQFYSLLNYKMEKYKNLEFSCKDQNYSQGREKLNGLGAFQVLTTYFIHSLSDTPEIYLEKNIDELRDDFMNQGINFFQEPISSIISYLYTYKNLIDLIYKSDLKDNEKALYIDVLSNSMFMEEQIVLFWISPLFPDLKKFIDGSYIFNQIWYHDSFKEYALKYHKKENFRVKGWIEIFENT